MSGLWRSLTASLLLVTAMAASPPTAEAQSRPATGLTDGAELFAAGCAGCHGPSGAGESDSTVGFVKPSTYPDFTSCEQTSPEVQADWWATIHDGGKARGFSRIMPAFGDLLTSDQITALVRYIRSLCQDRAWAVGELNLPRPLVTEKAFPEDETIVTSTIGPAAAGGRGHDAVTALQYEHRIGATNQIETQVPFAVAHDQSGTAQRGVGDVELGLKHVLFSSPHPGSIVSLLGVVTLPAGNSDKGLGTGTTVFEGSATFGQLLPRNGFVQGQAGMEQGTDRQQAPRAGFLRLAGGTSFRADGGLGRMWSPMLEFIATRDFVTGASTDIDLIPEMQVTLSQRQHVRGLVGVQLPVTDRSDRPKQVGFYLLWDWFDGGLFSGWK
ncbi:MAG TPA: cytochrome c [Vicinamibacterales bacterium]|nr:cytochrome c [Vicinamibacterales bacterium]